MPKLRITAGAQGFSLAEMMVALVFTMLLMAGMTVVFKTSIANFYTSGENLSSARRNRMSVDLMGDDLNSAGMYLMDLSVPPPTAAANPPFYILPNMTIKGPDGTTDAVTGPDDPSTTDEIYFYMDEALPFTGELKGTGPGAIGAEGVVGEKAPVDADKTFLIECWNDSYAKSVKKGLTFIFKDSWETGYIAKDPVVVTPTQVRVVLGADPNAAVTGRGSAGVLPKAKHLDGSGVIFIQRAQMVRYRIQYLNLDPSKANGIPCLVRDQGDYADAGYTPAAGSQVIISENVSGFKVYLSANSQDWAGYGLPSSVSGFNSGWDGSDGIRSLLDAQLAAAGRPGYLTTRVGEHWFRSIPTMVRVDVTTRTATQRTEYDSAAKAGYDPANPRLAYRELTQSLVFVPRHFGLSMK